MLGEKLHEVHADAMKLEWLMPSRSPSFVQ
jgi:hypothetical protein